MIQWCINDYMGFFLCIKDIMEYLHYMIWPLSRFHGIYFQILSLVFWSKQWHQKDISKLTARFWLILTTNIRLQHFKEILATFWLFLTVFGSFCLTLCINSGDEITRELSESLMKYSKALSVCWPLIGTTMLPDIQMAHWPTM